MCNPEEQGLWNVLQRVKFKGPQFLIIIPTFPQENSQLTNEELYIFNETLRTTFDAFYVLKLNIKTNQLFILEASNTNHCFHRWTSIRTSTRVSFSWRH